MGGWCWQPGNAGYGSGGASHIVTRHSYIRRSSARKHPLKVVRVGAPLGVADWGDSLLGGPQCGTYRSALVCER